MLGSVTAFFAIRENQARLFTILKKRERTYTYMGAPCFHGNR